MTHRDHDRARALHRLAGRSIHPRRGHGDGGRDLDLVGKYVARVSSQRRGPSWYTAKGVAPSGMTSVRVAVQGLGHVGAYVATMLLDAGAEITVADVDAQKVWAIVTNVGGPAMSAEPDAPHGPVAEPVPASWPAPG